MCTEEAYCSKIELSSNGSNAVRKVEVVIMEIRVAASRSIRTQKHIKRGDLTGRFTLGWSRPDNVATPQHSARD